MTTKVGIAWFRKEQWSRLLSVSTDRDNLEKTFDEWSRAAEKQLTAMKAAGKEIEKIDVDVEELINWCEKKNVPIDGKARARFAAEKFRQKDA